MFQFKNWRMAGATLSRPTRNLHAQSYAEKELHNPSFTKFYILHPCVHLLNSALNLILLSAINKTALLFQIRLTHF